MTDDSSSRESLTEGSGEVPLSMIRSLLRSKYIVVEGGGLTAEAREPSRKRRLHYQLQLARRLRAQMEQAADQVEAAESTQEAREVMVSSTPHIHELVSLTEAVRGGYTLDSYQEDWGLEEMEKEQKRQTDTAKEVLLTQLRCMHEQRIRNAEAKTPAVVAAVAGGVALEPMQVESLPDVGSAEAQKRPAEATNLTKDASPPNKRKKIDEALVAQESPPNVPKKPFVAQESPPNVAKKAFVAQESPPDVTKKPLVSNKKGASSTLVNTKAALRKCHHCKVATTRFRRCHFWFANGTRCGKTFCKDCLVATYGAAKKDWEGTESDADWHCPSCLNQCTCASCDKKREKEKKRPDESGGDRRTSKRTSPGLGF